MSDPEPAAHSVAPPPPPPPSTAAQGRAGAEEVIRWLRLLGGRDRH